MFTTFTKHCFNLSRSSTLKPFSIFKRQYPNSTILLNPLFSPFNKAFSTAQNPTSSPLTKGFKLAVFSSQPYDRRFFDLVNKRYGFTIAYHTVPLNAHSTSMIEGADAVCAFVNDSLDAEVLESLHKQGVRAVALRCAGFNQVDLEAAKRLGIEVSRVPAYSPEAVAEHAIALLMTLNRRIHKAFNRVREGNFALEGLLGQTLHGKTAGVVGIGKIGLATAKILHGFGCKVLGYDPVVSEEFKNLGKQISLEELLKESDVVTLHCPLMPQTHHMLNSTTFDMMKKGSFLINTSRGGLIDTTAAIQALKSKQLGGLAVDVYEQESSLFFRDLSSDIIQDDVFERLMTFPNVLVTGHQGFFTQEALNEIAEVTFANLGCLVDGKVCENALVHRGAKGAHKKH